MTGQIDAATYHRIGLFASKKINVGDELTMDFQWDKNDLNITEDVPCLCGSYICRGFLMRAKKAKKVMGGEKSTSVAQSPSVEKP